MSTNYKKLGDYITQRREKNTTINLPICGLCREGLIPPKQQDADISLYNVFYKNDFIFNPARMELNSITLNTEYDKAICSSLYEIFYINDTSKLLPEFLFVQLKTDNFVRFCEFQGQGSVREYCRFANISEYPVIVPDLKEQEKIVNTYNAITKRIQLKQKINENLEKTAQCLFEEYYRKENLEKVILSNLVDVRDGTHDSPVFLPKGYPLVTSQNLSPFYINKNETNKISEEDYKKINERSLVETNDILMSMIGTVGNVSLVTDEKVTFAIKNVALLKTSMNTTYRNWVLCFLKSHNFSKWLNETLTGSTQQYVSLGEIRKISFKIPTINELNKFNLATNPIINMIIKETAELVKLQELKQLVISRISGM